MILFRGDISTRHLILATREGQRVDLSSKLHREKVSSHTRYLNPLKQCKRCRFIYWEVYGLLNAILNLMPLLDFDGRLMCSIGFGCLLFESPDKYEIVILNDFKCCNVWTNM